ncbi:MAG TPA: type II secretion protein F, partial [Propionibacteriaceae bacterium]|nr:type II secretion protein F [Propionibacteriaceae bacterium]
ESQRELERAATERVRRVSVSTVLPLMVCYLPAFLLLGVVPIIGGVVANWFR